MAFKHVLLLSGLAVSGAWANKYSHPNQDFIDASPVPRDLRFAVNTETSVTRPGEVATVELYFSSEGSSRARVYDELVTPYDAVAAALAALPQAAEILTREVPNLDPERSGRGFSPRQSSRLEIDGAEDDAEDEQGYYYGNGMLRARFTDMDAWAQFMGNLTEEAQRAVSNVEWDLTDATKADARQQLRTDAVGEARTAGRGYGQIFESAVRMVEFEENYLNDQYWDDEWRWRRANTYDANVEPRDVKMTLSAKATFVLA